MKHKLLIAAAFVAALLGVSIATPSYALDKAQDTFTVTETGDDVVELRFGSNLLLAGNFVNSDKSTQSVPANGLLFTAGNQVGLDAKSEYAFVAGNVVNYGGTTEKDLFVAGNIITIQKTAKVSRDAFIAGNAVNIAADLPSDLSITAAKVILSDVKIGGNLNIAADTIIIEGKVSVTGKFTVNADATIEGFEKLTAGEVEKYEIIEHDITATEILLAKIFSIAALFVAFAIIMALFPAVKHRVASELNFVQFGKDIFIGMMVLLFVPIIAVFLLISLVGAPAALLLLATYVAVIYLAQGYTGLWLGKLIVEKLAHSELNAFLEMLIGITVLALLTMIPWAGTYIGLLSLLLGLGLFMQSIKPDRSKDSANKIASAKTTTARPQNTTKRTKPSPKTTKTQSKKTVKEKE